MEELDYELATEKQINWLRKHNYNDEEGLKIMSKKMADMLIKEFPHLKEWEGKIEKRGEKRKIKALMLTCNKRKYYL